MTAKGRLFLVPVPLDLGSDDPVNLDEVLPLKTLRTAASLTHWICENAKTTRAFLNRVALHVPLAQALQAQSLQELPRQAHKQGDHLHDPNVDALLAPALQGHDMGLVSEAGMPAVADPGSSVVRAAHKQGIAVVPLVGPSSPLLALAASGMNGQSFAFWGYLPVEASERIKAIERLAVQAQHGQAQLFIEVPHRNAALFQSLIDTLPPDLHLSLASNLTQAREAVRSLTVAAWRQSPPTLDKHQAVLFVVGRWPR